LEKLFTIFKEVISAVVPISIIIIIAILALNLGVDLPQEQTFTSELWISFIGGTVMVIIGMTLFLIGSEISMMEIGKRTGSFLMKKANIYILLIFGFAVGFVVTLAEPGVLVLANQVNAVSDVVNKQFLIIMVSVGSGLFLVISLLRVVFQLSINKILILSYILTFIVARFTPANFVPISFDAGGVTTGPITVPFILSFATGVTSIARSKNGANDSFGMIGLASIGPVLAVLITGVVYR
jgi:hypothetical protein